MKYNILYDFQVFWQQKFGGVSRYHIELYKQSQKTNYKITLTTVFLKNFYLNKMKNKYACIVRNIIGYKHVYKLNKLLTKYYLNKEKVDIIHPTWYDPYIFSIKGNSKIIITIHDMIHELFWENTAKDEIARKKYAIYNADAIIAISKNTKNDILKIYPDIPNNKISVVYHGTSHLPDAQRPNNFDVPEKYILFVGGRHDYKRGMFLAKALREFLKQYHNVKLLYLGGGSFNRDEISYIHELNLTDRIIQKDVSDAELAYLYSHAVCFVYPSLYEGFGLPILEAFDNNCPVICARNSSLTEVGGNAALYFENDDDVKLAQLVDMLLNNEEVRKKCIKLGKKRAMNFTWNKCFQETCAVYKKIMNGH